MKKVKIILILSLVLCLSCKKRVADLNSEEKNSTASVSIENTKDKTEVEDAINTQSFKKCNETFEEFFYKFGNDSIFQKSRIKYPLKLLYNDYEIDSLIIVKEYNNKNEYKYFDFTEDKNAINKESEKYTVDIEKSDSIVKYRHLGYDNGIMDTYTFKLIDGCWHMVEILDEST
tara:strand:+ start:71 stop:592 length:522 start_codon:yes stop_codon:yes gene_type:complete